MTDEDADATDPPTAAEAFGILGDETRTGILRALLEHDGGTPVTFSELRAAVGSEDSGRFNYHLQQLVGHFIERTEDGYDFRHPGRRIAHAILAGTYTERATMEPTPAPGACHACGAEALEARYEDEQFTIRCGECGETLVVVPFPPVAIRDRTGEEVLAAFDRWSTTQGRLAADGICPECTGHMDGAVTENRSAFIDFPVIPRFECRVCRRRAVTAFGSVALGHPDVIRFHHRHDSYPRQRPYWTTEQLVGFRHTTVESEDPWRIRVTFPVDGERVEATIDEAVEVVDVTASDR
jgi:DNA-binding transcriptional ArsR family regulator